MQKSLFLFCFVERQVQISDLIISTFETIRAEVFDILILLNLNIRIDL
jgi:hypothetical protein